MSVRKAVALRTDVQQVDGLTDPSGSRSTGPFPNDAVACDAPVMGAAGLMARFEGSRNTWRNDGIATVIIDCHRDD